jgi:serine/threonine-protein kinase
MADVPAPGTVFAEKYVIVSELGGGTAGVVLSATHRDLRQQVALKVLRESGTVAKERMIREARAAIAVQSEHVVRVMDVGYAGGHVYLVMEQLDGVDLATLLKRRGPLPVGEAVDLVLQACAGVAEAHARGVVHRDLKPSNLFLTKRGDGSPLLKVLDFGISKWEQAEGDAEASLTGTVEVLGSPMYMSPEQVRGAKHVDHRSDLWSLGVILFRLMTGKAPFEGGPTVSAALAAIVADEPSTLRQALPGAPRELEGVVRKCLAKSPEDRFARVADLAAALAPFGTEEGRSAVARLLRDRSSVSARRWSVRRWPSRAGGAVVVVGLAIGAVMVVQRGWGSAGASAGSGSSVGAGSGSGVGAGAGSGAVAGSGVGAGAGSGAVAGSGSGSAEAPSASEGGSTAQVAAVAAPSGVPARPQRRPGVRAPRPGTDSNAVRSAAMNDRR